MKISVYKGDRQAWFRTERQPTYIMVGWGNPNKHTWWARTIYVYW